MYRIRNQQPPLPDPVTEAGFADGFIYICQQAALLFGSDRTTPTRSRPVVGIKQHGARVVVLPCTTRGKQESEQFFDLNKNDRVMWVSPEKSGTESMAYYRYELVAWQNLEQRKIGLMPQSARIELLDWLKARY